MEQLAKEHGGIIKYIQMSCLGASNDSPSSLLRSKAAGEEATLRNFPEVGPSIQFITICHYLHRYV